MRSLLVVILISFASLSSLRAQDSTRLERTAYVLGSSLAFSLIDYVAYNHIIYDLNKEQFALDAYRVFQVGVQAALTYFLYKQCGLSSAISFNVIWFTWGDDLGYYGWANLLNPAGPWENRTRNGLHGRQIDWAWWTPIGLTRPHKSLIARDVLITQSLFGFALAIVIL